jgi:hypothetical protein
MFLPITGPLAMKLRTLIYHDKSSETYITATANSLRQ